MSVKMASVGGLLVLAVAVATLCPAAQASSVVSITTRGLTDDMSPIYVLYCTYATLVTSVKCSWLLHPSQRRQLMSVISFLSTTTSGFVFVTLLFPIRSPKRIIFQFSALGRGFETQEEIKFSVLRNARVSQCVTSLGGKGLKKSSPNK